jgi:hypothetical protein
MSADTVFYLVENSVDSQRVTAIASDSETKEELVDDVLADMEARRREIEVSYLIMVARVLGVDPVE